MVNLDRWVCGSPWELPDCLCLRVVALWPAGDTDHACVLSSSKDATHAICPMPSLPAQAQMKFRRSCVLDTKGGSPSGAFRPQRGPSAVIPARHLCV